MANLSWLRYAVPLIIFIVIAVFLAQGLKHDPTHLPSTLVNKKMPAFSLTRLYDPQQIITANDIKGPALVNVWATWCPSCRIEHPVLNALAGQGVTVYGLNYKDERDAAIRYLEQYENPYKLVIFDDKGNLGLDLGVYGAPETFFVDKAGIIRHRHVGVVSEKAWQDELLPIWQNMLIGKAEKL